MTQPSIDSNANRRLDEILSSLEWLAQLLRFRLQARTPEGSSSPGPGLTGMIELIDEFSRDRSDKAPAASPTAPPPIPAGGWLPSFAVSFGIDPIESLLVVAAVAPSFDGRFALAFGEAQGANHTERATADLVGRLLALSLAERARIAASLRPGGRLEQYGLLNLDWSDSAGLPVNLQPLEVPERVRWHLVDGSDLAPPSVRAMLEARPARFTLDDVPLTKETVERVSYCVQQLNRAANHLELLPLVLLEGPPGAGQLEAAECIAHERGLGLIDLDLSQVLSGNEPAGLAMSIRREAILRGSAVLIRMQVEDLVSSQIQRRARYLVGQELRELPVPLMLCGNMATLAVMNEIDRPLLRLELRLPDRTLQRRAIEAALETHHLKADSKAVDELLNRYNLDLVTAGEVVRTARVLALSARDADGELRTHELETGIEIILSRSLGSLSQRLTARFDWDDLVLPLDLIVQLRTLRNLIEFRHQVFEEWGLGKKGSSGHGIKALFSGASGTGKTMAAEVIASDLRLPLYRVDLSAVVSKWVGETEKNLEKIFREAQASQAILLFDEADALFGKRGEVENANDRHANLEVSFLLQRFEVHDGVVILTSNFPSVIDNAFSRRMHFLVDFPVPDVSMRTILWNKQLIPSLPLGDDIDVSWLANRFELSGANIRNIVMGGAFLTASERGRLGMSQLIRALAWEHQKLGRSVGAGEFGKYYRYLETPTP